MNFILPDETKKKFARPTAEAKIKDAKLPVEKYLEIENKQSIDAKAHREMKPMTVNFIAEGADRTLDDLTNYPRKCEVKGANAQMTVQEFREVVARQEKMEVEDVNIYTKGSVVPNHLRLGQCFADWMGFGLETWPPAFIVKPRVRGFEVSVTVPASRDTQVWNAGALQTHKDRHLVFDVEPTTTAGELKELVAKQVKIPPARQLLTAMVHKDERSINGDHVSLDDNSKTMADYGIDTFCAKIVLEKNPFDENGMYVFDDAYWDDKGYHPQPVDCWIPTDSISNRSRPDAQKNDPNVPGVILTDRRAAENARSEAEAKSKSKAKAKA